MTALPPANERDRLRVLREYEVLDSEAEQSFDDIVRLAAYVCETPSAMVTLVDESRQWFKSSIGLAFRETHRDVSFCAHAILARDVLLVPDTTKDPRFRENPLVTGPPGIRFYAGVPLVSEAGFALGTLAVIDSKPRQLTPEQIQGLETLSRQVMAQLELRRRVARHSRRAISAETTLQTAAEYHRFIFDSTLDAIVIMDPAGRVMDFNAAAEQLFGYARSEVVGRSMADVIIPPEYHAQHARGLARYLATGERVILGRRIEATARRRDGTRFPVELTVQRLAGEEPAVFAGFIRDITERTRATRELRASTERYGHQRRALTRLIQDERLYHDELPHALRQITETVAMTLGVARVSVWQLSRDHSVIRCLDLYERDDDRHSRDAELPSGTAPAYFEALGRLEVISANDARHDPRTRELSNDYVENNGIASMLSAPVHLHGALTGVLSVEHRGGPREWTADEQTFTVATANLVSLALEGDQRRQAQSALVTQTEILTAVTESLAAYAERSDWKEAFSRLLRCALGLTTSEYGFVGVVVGAELRVLAHEGIVWDKVLNREFYERALRHYREHGYVTFHSFDNLFGFALTTGEVVIANDPDHDARAKGRPAGHPPMSSFLGVPIRGRNEVTGLIALANRPAGYGQQEAERIQALVQQAGGLCESYRQRERARVQEEERKQAEAALLASDERLRLVARATNDAVWDWDLETNALFVPEGFGKLFGDEGQQPHVTWEAWYSRIHPDDQARVERSCRAAIDGGAHVWSDEYRFRRSDGSYATVLDRGYVLRNQEGRPVRMIGAMTDISERKQLEAQFRQAQKLEAVGQLAGGVAHDFNNILTIIKGHVSLLLSDSGHTRDADNSLRQIDEAAERAAGLTRQLLAFSRKQVLQTTDLDMNEIVRKMMRLLERLLGEHIRLEIDPSVTAAFVRADASMMEQIILNLAINARDAMPEGGRLLLTTTTERLEAHTLPDHSDARSGEFVRLSVSDSGSGIAPDVLPHIFEPFFTTKGIERGTGLGLATVYGIVKQHLGWVTVESVLGEGTTFNVYLPLLTQPTKRAAVTSQKGLDERGTETVLIVEDEESVRRLARILLERHGYKVLEAECGPAALSVWRQVGGGIDLLVTDMVMPDGLSGLELANQMRREQPDLRVVVTSGYSVDLAGKDVAGKGRVTFLPKPYSVHEFLHAVRASLDTR
jgi:PAS domain S-box-containing protein